MAKAYHAHRMNGESRQPPETDEKMLTSYVIRVHLNQKWNAYCSSHADSVDKSVLLADVPVGRNGLNMATLTERLSKIVESTRYVEQVTSLSPKG